MTSDSSPIRAGAPVPSWSDRGSPSPRVSIITPAFNAGRFISETIESVIGQTFNDFELLIVDDGSTDDTAAIVSKYCERDSRIRLFQQPNRGIAVARNVALAAARGSYFALLDSDDVWLPTYLADQLQVMERRPDIAILSANAYNLGGYADGELLLDHDPASGIRHVSLGQLIDAEATMSVLAVLRREVIDTIGGFDSSFRRSEDYDLWLRAAAAGFSVAINPMPLGRYRRRPDSLSSDEGRMLAAIQQPLKKVRQSCADRSDIVAQIDAQLARIVFRAHLASARAALIGGDMASLAARFADLASLTDAVRYRLARWLTLTAPFSIRAAYRLKHWVLRLRRRHTARTSAGRLPHRLHTASDAGLQEIRDGEGPARLGDGGPAPVAIDLPGKRVIGYVKENTLATLEQLGVSRRIGRSAWRRRRLLILCYHGISLSDEHEWAPGLYVSLQHLERRLSLIREEGCTVLPLGAAVAALYAGDLPDRAVVLTFDDGYYDFAARAWPLLKALGHPATLYLTTGRVDRHLPNVNLFVSYALWCRRGGTLDARGFLGLTARYPLHGSHQRDAALRDITRAFQANRTPQFGRDQLARLLVERLGLDYEALIASRLLTLMRPDEVSQIASEGLDVQMHTHLHRTPPDVEEFVRDVLVNRDRIETMTGVRPVHFCYPSGNYRREYVPALGRAGIRTATTCDPGMATPAGNPLLLPRVIDTSMVPAVVFRSWLTGMAEWLPRRTRRGGDSRPADTLLTPTVAVTRSDARW